MHQEVKAQHRDHQAGEKLQGRMAIPKVVRGDYLIVLLIHVLLATSSIVHVQIISQFCQERRKTLNAGSPTASGVRSSWPSHLSGLLGWPGFEFFLPLKGRLPGDGKKTRVWSWGPARGRGLVLFLPESTPRRTQAGHSPPAFGSTHTLGYTLALVMSPGGRAMPFG